jgi:hypothetical protein
LPLHHAGVKEVSKESVELLLPKAQKPKQEPLHQEDGAGLTPLDCAMLKTSQVFHSDRYVFRLAWPTPQQLPSP